MVGGGSFYLTLRVTTLYSEGYKIPSNQKEQPLQLNHKPKYGDPDWKLQVAPSASMKSNFRYSTPTASATFAKNPIFGLLDANTFAGSAGTVAIFA